MNKLLIIQHEDKTSPGTTLDWAQQNDIDVDHWHPAQARPFPHHAEYKAVIICGGSMDTFEEDKHPWLREEKIFIRSLIDHNKKIFGICLGSQLLAEALGGQVHQHHGWEIGFVPVVTGPGPDEILHVMQSHRYTFTLPPGADLIASNDFCRNQAYTFGDNIIATQFHPEATVEWITRKAHSINPERQGQVQTKEELLASAHLQKPLQDWYFKQLDRWFK
ncbi:MAG: type 1 glutamine amidotransferase [Bdellovibrio sp.]